MINPLPSRVRAKVYTFARRTRFSFFSPFYSFFFWKLFFCNLRHSFGYLFWAALCRRRCYLRIYDAHDRWVSFRASSIFARKTLHDELLSPSAIWGLPYIQSAKKNLILFFHKTFFHSSLLRISFLEIFQESEIAERKKLHLDVADVRTCIHTKWCRKLIDDM